MKTKLITAGVVGWFAALLAYGQTPEAVMKSVKWERGPAVGRLGTWAEIQIPAGFVFAGPQDTRKLMEMMQNPTHGNELGFVAPEGLEWFVIFHFTAEGYVPDTEKTSLDAEALLQTIKKGTAAGNEARRKRGWPELTVLGWEIKPRYDEASHNLEWAIRGQSEGSVSVNYNTRLLGRSGIMSVTLVTDPAALNATLPRYKSLIAGYGFVQGQRYAEFRQGDKIAKYGLSALVAGGAAAVAVKSGAFKYLWKLIVLVGLGVAAFFRRLVGGRKPQ